jgi:predicted nucleotidyltransferase
MGLVSDRQLEMVRDACLEVYGDNLVALAVFGSVGRGSPSPASDVDLLVVLGRRPGGRFACLESFEAVERRLEEAGLRLDLSPVFRTVEDLAAGFPLLLDMVEDARILFDREGVLAAALERLRARLKALGARRIPYKGSWYWDLKPDYKPGEVFRL